VKIGQYFVLLLQKVGGLFSDDCCVALWRCQIDAESTDDSAFVSAVGCTGRCCHGNVRAGCLFIATVLVA